MPVDAPTITQTAPTTGLPLPAGSEVADLFSATATSYAISDDPDSLFTVAADKLNLAAEGSGAHSVSVTATDGVETSTATTATLTFGDDEPEDLTDDYPENPNLPPPTADAETWRFFIVAATHAIVPFARDGVDFSVSRTAKDAPLQNVAWNDELLGPRPDAEIEAEARRLAELWPTNVHPV